MKRLLLSLLGGLLLLFLVACSTEDVDGKLLTDGLYVYELRLDGGVHDYSDATRAAKVWKNGDVVYLRFSASGNVTLGTATYGSGKWTLTTDKLLAGSGSCQAVKIDNATSSNSSSVTLSSQSAVYEDRSGTWSLSGNTLNVQATLNPLLGRLRFKGISGTSFSLMGLITYTSYDISTGTFTQTQAAVSGSITSSGYSSYIYGLMLDTSKPTLATNGYNMECSTTMMQAGQSGWLNYPTATSHTGWADPYNGHEYVDLGLSVRWATCNVGADNPEDYGDYYAWGETETKDTYNWSIYKLCNGSSSTMTKYCTSTSYGKVDSKATLDSEDDVAHVKWGGTWRMPTRAEQAELRSDCTWTEATLGGKKGYRVTSKKNGNSIFLPFAGYRLGSSLYNTGSYGYYWSSSLYESKSSSAYNLYFFSGRVDIADNERYLARSVRPVCL